MDWSAANTRYVFPARRMLLSGRALQGEDLLRQGFEETGDGWIAYHLAEAILFQSPDDRARVEDACRLYAHAVERLSEGHRALAEAALAKAEAMMAVARPREASPRTFLPRAEEAVIRRPRVSRETEVEEERPPDPLIEKLKTDFRFEEFRPGQREVIEAVLQGRHVLAVMPPGAGRSLLWEFATRLLEGSTVVVSSSAVSGDRLIHGAPDKLGDPGFLDGAKVGLFVIDDAQRICEGSADFRPEYVRLKGVVHRAAAGAVLALAPLATPQIRGEIIDKLGLVSPVVQAISMDRRNLIWSVVETQDRFGALRTVLAEWPGAAIVYARRAQDAESMAARLREAGLTAAAVYEGVADRNRAVEEWRANRVRVLVAVKDRDLKRPDVRGVVHWQMPASLEEYYLEAALAGRDGQPSQCVLLHGTGDKDEHLALIERMYPGREGVLEVLEAISRGASLEEWRRRWGRVGLAGALEALEGQGFIRAIGEGAYERPADGPNVSRLEVSSLERRQRRAEERLRAMERYAEARGCRRMEMLVYFGEQPPAGWLCGGCDRCRAAREGASQDAGVLRQAVVMGVRELETRRFSINEMARAILFLAPPHVTRALKGKAEAEVRDVIHALLRDGAIELDSRGQFVRAPRGR
ncbi:MAG: ATP-dependent DNA helicase RecQ [Planctomycetes bacterium]|nr:ATP-dependent DNA helicase RecQ [Planctomycetota bacterium]